MSLSTVVAPALAAHGNELDSDIHQSATFAGWLAALKAEARAKGISDATLDAALKDVKSDPKIIKFDRNQPEFKLTFNEYLTRVAPPFRVNRGKRLLKKHKELLANIQARFGVQPRFIVALWGMETDFGRLTGGFNVVHALVTLAYDGRRSHYFRGELINALKIIDAGHVTAVAMTGSWAGAMGQTQFMPSTFLKHAIDFNGDGKTNVWTDSSDALASGANYLSKTGWKGDETWGREVKLPADFPKDMLELDVVKPISFWQAMGVRRIDGKDLPAREISASIVQLDDKTGAAYMVYDNYRAIMDWNKSKNFATAVGILADRIGGY
ncbi:MAG: lytic murein transglycosylase [Gammaproteobacteria bacterium]|nr:lytic murein transglycosylase [Gammaproteobacteria bacterium]